MFLLPHVARISTVTCDGHTHLGAAGETGRDTGMYRYIQDKFELLFIGRTNVCLQFEFTGEVFLFLRSKRIFDVWCIYWSAWCALTNTPHWIIYLYSFGFMIVVNLNVDNRSVLCCWCESNKMPVKILTFSHIPCHAFCVIILKIQLAQKPDGQAELPDFTSDHKCEL